MRTPLSISKKNSKNSSKVNYLVHIFFENFEKLDFEILDNRINEEKREEHAWRIVLYR